MTELQKNPPASKRQKEALKALQEAYEGRLVVYNGLDRVLSMVVTDDPVLGDLTVLEEFVLRGGDTFDCGADSNAGFKIGMHCLPAASLERARVAARQAQAMGQELPEDLTEALGL